MMPFFVLLLVVLGAPAEWAIFRGDRGLTGRAVEDCPEEPELLWSFSVGQPIASSPVVAGGRVFFGADDGGLHCLALADGAERWSFQTEDMVEAPPLVVGGRVFVGSSDGWFYAVDAESGSLLWKHETGAQILGSANWLPAREDRPLRVVVGSYDASLYCFEADGGKLLWTHATEDRLNGAPAVAGERIMIGGCDTVLHVVSGQDGRKLGEVPMGEACHIAASVGVLDDRVYLGHYGNEFVCVDLKTEAIVWRYASSSQPFFSPPAIGAKVVLFGGRDKRVHCLDRETGEPLWTFPTRRKVDSAPLLAGDKVVVASGDGRLRILSVKDGRELWSYDIGRPIYSSPALSDGKLLIGAADGRLYAFGDKPGR